MSHIAAVMGLEYHHPIMNKLWGHGGRSKRKTTQRGGARVSRRWWDQKDIDWKTAKERAEETDSESES